jgi:capsular polysaccharide transport system permease protein
MTDTTSLAAVLPARPKRRHWGTLISFVLMVIAPTVLASWYLWERAADRYVSTMSFSVRAEEGGGGLDLGGLGVALSSSSTSDPEILYDFIQSQELVRQVDRDLDLRAIWSRVPYWQDPLYAYNPPGTIEDLTDHWRRMVQVFTASSSGLLELRVEAFDPRDAQAIAIAVRDRSSEMINELSAIARADATGYAREELVQAEERLRTARAEVTRFRNRTQIVDPQASMQSQMGILTALQSQYADLLVEIDILEQSASAGDPRLVQARRRLEVIEARIAEEQAKFGGGDVVTPEGNTRFADLVAEFEGLRAEQEFAEDTYRAARSAYDAALAEARRQSRYLAAHVAPTMAESAIYPRRLQLALLVALFSFLIWGIVVLAAYALRDRR